MGGNIEKYYEDKYIQENAPKTNIPINHDSAPVSTNEKGGKQSELQARFDLLPPIALTLVAKVLQHGAVRHGEWNWERIPTKDHVNHSLGHTFSYSAGDTQDQLIADASPEVNHLAKAACRALFALETQWYKDLEDGRV